MDTRAITGYLKGIAIFFVFLCHSPQSFHLPGSLNAIFGFLQIGVQLFLLLSAMGLCFSHSKSKDNWFAFMKKRLSKLVIPFWFAIALDAMYRIAYAVFLHEDILQKLNLKGILVNMFFLHGFSGDPVISNGIVRGGWFVGTIVILYALFPLLYRLYFSNQKLWEKNRVWAFPLGILITSSIVMKVLAHFIPDHALVNLFRQLPAFALGFPLYDLQVNNAICKIKFPLVKACVFALCAIALYFFGKALLFLYVFCISVAFFYLFIHHYNHPISGKSPINRFFSAMGTYSFSIYLTHAFVAFDLCFVLNKILSRFYRNDLLWFLLLQPFVIAIAYYVGKYFEIVTAWCKKKLEKPRKQHEAPVK